MSQRVHTGALMVIIAVMVTAWPSASAAQDPRLTNRFRDGILTQVTQVVDSARAEGLPAEPLIDRALEGAAKGAPPDRIVVAIRHLWGELRTALDAFGDEATPAELTAGASALRAGATREDLAELRIRRPGQSLTVAAGVLADLVAVGVPSDTAVAAVLAMAANSGDAEYIAFRRNVERDIALGASPTDALGVRLEGFSDAAAAPNSLSPGPGLEVTSSSSGKTTRKRKP